MNIFLNNNKIKLYNINRIITIHLNLNPLQINPSKITIKKNETVTLNVIYDKTTEFDWYSSNSGFVTVNNGVLFGAEEGYAVITCVPKDNPNLSATCTVEVIGNSVITSTDRILDNEYPYISVYNFEPTLDINDNLIIPYYITDYTQKEIRENDYSDNFNVTCSIYTMPDNEGNINLISSKTVSDVRAGDNSITFESTELGNVGDKFIVIEGEETNSSKNTFEFIKEFRVIDKVAEESEITNNTYYMTENDLITYSINNTDSSTDPDIALSTRTGLQSLMDDKAASGVRKLVLLEGTYIIKYAMISEALSIPNKFTLDLNKSTIKLLYDENNTSETTAKTSVIMKISHKYDSHIINGTVSGDYLERGHISSSNGEHAYALHNYSSKYSSFEDLTVKDNSGYTMLWGYGDGNMATSAGMLSNFTSVDIKNGIEVDSENRSTSDFLSLSNIYKLRMGSVCVYLGYQGIHTDYQACRIHFYDSDKNFIETKTTFQWRRFLIPENSAYARVTMLGELSIMPNNLELLYYDVTTNILVKNISFENTRTCALAPLGSRGAIIDNCTFTNCGHKSPTPLAIDFEDGWDLTQDVLLKNCKMLQHAGTGDLITCAGNNYQLENLENFNVVLRTFSTNRTTGASVKNCTFTGGDFSAAHRDYKRTAWFRLNNCTATGMIICNDTAPMSFRIVKGWTFENGASLNGSSTAINCSFSDIEGKDFGKINSTTGFVDSGTCFKQCNLNNLYWQLNTCNFIDCTSSKLVKYRLNGMGADNVMFNNCTFDNGVSFVSNSHASAYLNICNINGINYDVSGATYINSPLIFENCNITFTETNKIMKSTSTNVYVKFKGCTINDPTSGSIFKTSKAGSINVYIEFIDCIINKTNGTLIEDGYFDNYHSGATLKLNIINTPLSIPKGNSNVLNSTIWNITES